MTAYCAQQILEVDLASKSSVAAAVRAAGKVGGGSGGTASVCVGCYNHTHKDHGGN
jgi:uncharacterized membrane protein